MCRSETELLPKIKVEIKPNNSFGEGVATPFQGVRDSRDSGHMGLMSNSWASVRDSSLILHSVAAPSTFGQRRVLIILAGSRSISELDIFLKHNKTI